MNGGNIPLLLAGPAKITFSYDDTTHQVGFTPVVAEDTTAADASLARASLRSSLTRERFYFVMADRFANGSTANDKGGLTGGPLTTGLDPTAKGFYHGGDLKGITARLDYIKRLGTTAIWLTPSFKNKPVQGAPGEESAGYHGYWITDFTQIDPHLGTNADMEQLIDAAHAKGMKVFFDIITNHTADVIDYRGGHFDFVARARDIGIDVPIIPGVMPILSAAGIKRMAELSAAKLPPRLEMELAVRLDDDEAVAELGVSYATLQCVELLERGAPGIHFITLNRSSATRAILSALRIARPWDRVKSPL